MSKSPPSVGYEFHAHESHVGDAQPGYQKLASEVAVAISYNGLNHAVMMATPEALEDFVLGYSLASGIVCSEKQLLDLEINTEQDAIYLNVVISQRAFHQYKVDRNKMRRTDAGSSACGLCGVEALRKVLNPAHNVIDGADYSNLPSPGHLHDLRTRFSDSQPSRNISGAMHAAIYVDVQGHTRICREDIGRHNALDKLIGGCVRYGWPLDRGFIAISSRCGFELVQKAVSCGVATLVSLSSPSDIAVRWARRYRLNLIHVPAAGTPRVYSALGVRR